MTTTRSFKEVRELDAREAECWRMFGLDPAAQVWDAPIREIRPVVMSTEDFYRLCMIDPAGEAKQ